MPLRINDAYTATSKRNINTAFNRLSGDFAKLSSGKSITKASDNAAGMAIVEQMAADISSADQAQRNISDGMSMTRVAEGALGSVSDMLTRARELSVQAANGTLSADQRAMLNNELNSIKSEIDRVGSVTEFNGTKLLDGTMAQGSATQVNVQAGIQNTPADRINLNVIEQTNSAQLGVAGADISTQQGAQNALSAIDTAIARVTSTRSNIGSIQNRFDRAASNIGVYKENITAASSNISDLDYAQGVSDFAKNQTLAQTATSVMKKGMKSQAASIGALLNIKG